MQLLAAAFAAALTVCVSCGGGPGEGSYGAAALLDTSVTRGVRAAIAEARRVFGTDSIADPAPFFARLDSTAGVLRAKVAGLDAEGRVRALAKVIYDDWGITFDPDQDELLSLLPHTIAARGKGSCLGVSLIFLMLAEKTAVPLHGVLLPGHFFVRYDDGERRRTIEPNRRAYAHPEAYYRERYGVAPGSWYDLRNLSGREALAVLRYNMANIYRAAGRLGEAIAAYRQCLSALPGFAEAWGNLAIALDARGAVDSARAAFHRVGKLRPGSPTLARNLGAFELRRGRPEAALEAYRAGLAHDPADRELRYGAGLTHCALGVADSAAAALRWLEEAGGDGRLARSLGEAIREGCGGDGGH